MGMVGISIGIILVIILLAIVFLLLTTWSSSGQRSTTTLACPPGFIPTQYYQEKYSGNGIAYDATHQTLCFVRSHGQQALVLPIQDLLLSQIVEDGEVLAQASRKDDTGTALLASILTPDIQATLESPDTNGSEHAQRSSTICESLILRVVVNHDQEPVHTIHFLDMETKKGGVIYNTAVVHIKSWQELLTSLIRQAGRTEMTTSPQPVAASSPSHP
ncbi:MAG: hypothetical protein D6704_00015 [Nitrospirae bacterium]|nr:MAG: hypothetical protein D6704_00015 [Nitrospirota bacterium]